MKRALGGLTDNGLSEPLKTTQLEISTHKKTKKPATVDVAKSVKI